MYQGLAAERLPHQRGGSQTQAEASRTASKYPPAKPGALACEPLKAA